MSSSAFTDCCTGSSAGFHGHATAHRWVVGALGNWAKAKDPWDAWISCPFCGNHLVDRECPPVENVRRWTHKSFVCFSGKSSRTVACSKGAVTMRDRFSGKFLGGLPMRHYCIDCLSQLYGEPLETIGEYLGETGITSRQGHCGNCGEHKETFGRLPRLIR